MTQPRYPTFRPFVVAYGSPDYRSCVGLRDAVLRRPLGLAITRKQIEAESEDLHIGCRNDSRLVGCAVLTPLSPGRIRLRQMAVQPAFRGQGVGTLLVSAAEDEARARGFGECVLHARESAIPFYLGLGYVVDGETFTEVSLPHRRMRKTL